ncbi:MAG: transcriptional regulator [Saprospiraceae bacterium]|nr:transcriptional regulator [Saprospiraceae bacterium]
MKELIEALDKTFDSRIRLGIMSALMVNEAVDFNTLKELLDATDGNLASHLKSMEAAAYITVQKSFVGRKPLTRYKATRQGRKAFESHVTALEKLIRYAPKPPKGDS